MSLAMVAGASAADLYTKAPPDELSPWYIAARAGLTNLSERDVDYTNPRVFATVGASDDRNFKFVGAAAVGFRLPAMPVRLEVEYASRGRVTFTRDTLGFCPAPCGGFAPVSGLNFNGYNSISFKNQTTMLNGYWDVVINPTLTAFVGAGAGVAFNETSATQVATVTFTPPDPIAIPPGVLAPFAMWPQRTTTSFAWSATAGVSANVTARLAVDLSYRVVGLGQYDTGINPNLFQDEQFRANAFAQEVLLGGRFRF